MSEIPRATRTFRVHARHAGPHHGRTVVEATFEAAAVSYVEHLTVLPDDGDAIAVVVRDVETGHEHSFTVSLEALSET